MKQQQVYSILQRDVTMRWIWNMEVEIGTMAIKGVVAEQMWSVIGPQRFCFKHSRRVYILLPAPHDTVSFHTMDGYSYSGNVHEED